MGAAASAAGKKAAASPPAEGGGASPTAGAAAAAAGAATTPGGGAAATGDRMRDTGEGLFVLPEGPARGRRLEDYYAVPDREVGRGHYGVVRRGVRRADGARVAVKTIPKRRAVYVDMLRTEINILRELDHPNIVRLYDQFEDERVVHLVFELCAGGELFEPIADSTFRFTERQASRMVRKVLLAVKYCHDRSIVHRDLKPENMLLSAAGVEAELKVIDFGLATPIKAGEMLTRHVGTPYYIAPEVLAKSYGKSCDLWSVGVIAFTLMCGFPPFWGDTEREIYARVRRGFYAFEGPDWATRSAQSKDFIQKLLVMNPKRRLTVDEALAHPWIVHEGEGLEPHSRRIITRLRHYTSFPWLKRLGLAVIARSMDAQQELYAREVFESFELNDDHVMTATELMASLRHRGAGVTREEVESLLEGMDLNRDGIITFTEFAAAVMPRLYYLNERQVCDVFAVLDVDHDGVITLKDLQHLVGDDAFAAATLAESDLDGDGAITFADFAAVLTGNECNIL